MKKALLLGLMGWLLAAAPAFAYPPVPATVNFASERGVPFGLVLDGRPLTRGMARQVHAGPLQPGQHWADFTVPTAYGGAVRFRSRVWLQPGLETTFVLVTRPGRPLYLQQVQAVALYAPGYGVGPSYYNNGGGRYNSPAPYGPGGSYGTPGSYPAPSPQGGYDYDEADDTDGYGTAPAPNGSYGTPPNSGPYGNNLNQPYGGPNPSSPGYGTPNAPNGGYGTNPNYPNGGDYNNAPSSTPAASNYRRLTAQDVDALLRTVQSRIADASKLSAAKDGLAERSLRTDDLVRLLRTTSSEACRIDLATFAYSHVSDPENFYRVYDVFTSESAARTVAASVHDTYRR